MPRVPYSGRTGFLQNVTSVEDWNVSMKADGPGVHNSGTKGGEMQFKGWQDWSGGFKCNNHLAIIAPGLPFTFGGSFDGMTGLVGPMISDSLDLNWDIEGGKPITQDIKLSGNGPYTIGPCAASEVIAPVAVTSFGTFGHLTVDAAVGAIATNQLPGVKSMSLRLQARNSEYKDSDTNGWIYRLKGPLTGSVSISVNVSDLTILPLPNTWGRLKLYVNGTQYWQISYVKFGELSGITSNRAGAVVGATLNAKWSSHYSDGVTSTQGVITGPSGTQLWPYANL